MPSAWFTKLGVTGLEPRGVTSCTDNGLRDQASGGAAKCAATRAQAAIADAELERVVDVWGELPDSVRAAMSALAKAAAEPTPIRKA